MTSLVEQLAGVTSLTDEQIDGLLAEAEVRLRARAAAKATEVASTSDDHISFHESEPPRKKRKAIPSLSHGLNTLLPAREPADAPSITLPKDAKPDLLHTTKKKSKQEKKEPADSGPSHFNMPRTVLTPQLKRDFQLLAMRSVLDPHRHYKKTSKLKKDVIPQFSQVGTVIEGPTEFYSSRINKKDRQKSFVDEAMGVEKESGRFKRKYDEIQGAKTSGKKAHYKGVLAKRKKS